MFINGRKRFLPFLYTFDSRNKGKGVKKQDKQQKVSRNGRKQEKQQKVSRNGRKRFLLFLDTFACGKSDG